VLELKTVIVTDSTSYVPAYIMEELDIHMIPLTVTINGKTYEEGVDITASEFYTKVRGEEVMPATSKPSTEKFTTLYESLKTEYDAVISIHLSSGISGAYNSAVKAGEAIDGIDVFAFDSEITCYLQGFYVIRAAELAKEGAEPQAIMDELNEMKKTMRAYFMVDDLIHLQHGGRLSSAQALIGGLLQVKPLMHFQGKVIVPFEKIFTRKKALNRMMDLLIEDAKKYRLEAVIIHANRPEEAKICRDELIEKVPKVKFSISHFGPVIGTHLGEGAMGLGWVQRKLD